MPPKSKPRPQQKTSATATGEPLSFEENYGEEHLDMDPLLQRIHDGIHYTRLQLNKNLSIMQTTRFAIPLPPITKAHGTALVLLRRAQEDNIAILISSSPTEIIYELGVPVPYFVSEARTVRSIHSPHWWVGNSAKETEAGPHAQENEVRKAKSNARGSANKWQKEVVKTREQKGNETKLEEGLRRQLAKESMCDCVHERNFNAEQS
ncbi:hypothetical protein EK21DRAFT_117440 [Setomelanomma holmii]|uniref:Uncharacterized protein n=1 Tax=Setomelanomma holmii TaxID=210430 RepID=A0A9P4GXM1_9PLEO|nr:hypothetical protein EK21DRAFT_117440 [Setomelanomma holmii]